MITRFAPSPTGPLHLGHAYSAMLAHDMAMAHGGTFHLRIEDIDQSRARPEYEAMIYEDLGWLGLWWPKPVMRQSDHINSYQQTLATLWDDDKIFSCSCNRRDIIEAANAPQEGVTIGPDGIVYPGTCRDNPKAPQIPQNTALRLSMAKAATQNFAFTETGHGPNGETGRIEFTPKEAIETIGDLVLARRDMGTSYHLSCVLDDAAMGITHVIRGADLFEATKIHVILQRLLGLPTPIYHHHRLIRDETGKRLAKRDDARAIRAFRADGATPADIRATLGL